MKLSVIIYHGKNDTTAMIDSLTSQLNDNVAIIIMDDGAKCKTLDKYKAYNITVRHSSKAIGKSATFEKALKGIRDGYVALFNASDELLPNFVETIESAAGDDVDVIAFGYAYVDWHGYIINGSENMPLRPFNTVYKTTDGAAWEDIINQAENIKIIADVLIEHKRGD
ncbi:MAG: glycosyltransferase [Clostridiales bacterium]|nr:glycosyltransferase [Clostridiales bacterium]